jgi:hypothetical protein
MPAPDLLIKMQASHIHLSIVAMNMAAPTD